jgi:hypothetical protein
MGNYTVFLNEADSYYKIVESNMKKNKKLGNKVLFSISSMVIEKYMVSILMAKGVAVNGHSIRSLVEKAKQNIEDLPPQIITLKEIDKKLDLCSFNAVSYDNFNDNDMQELYINLKFLKDYVHTNVAKTELS